jgi:hypothetical protein
VRSGARAVAALVAALLVGGCAERAPSAPMAVSAPAAAPAHASRDRAVAPVRALGTLRAPDLYVSARGISTTQVAALRRIRGVRSVAVLATGTVRLGGSTYEVSAVDPSSVRAFTPKATARSDALWAAVARGELAVSYAAGVPLGRTVTVGGLPLRAGAQAVFGLPATDLVVSKQVGAAMGLRDSAVVIAAPKRAVSRLSRDVRHVLGRGADLTVLRASALQHRRPRTYQALYQLAASYCPGLSWKVLAAIGQVESGHGRNVGPSSAGALGPMQFLPSTWAFSGVDGDGDGRADIMSPYDAVPAAALYLCRAGAARGGRSLYRAIYSYNHADWYVKKVLALAARY